jgi:hypothetical protein
VRAAALRAALTAAALQSCSREQPPAGGSGELRSLELKIQQGSRGCAALAERLGMGYTMSLDSGELNCELTWRDGSGFWLPAGCSGSAQKAIRAEHNGPKRNAYAKCATAACDSLKLIGDMEKCDEVCATKTGYELGEED